MFTLYYRVNREGENDREVETDTAFTFKLHTETNFRFKKTILLSCIDIVLPLSPIGPIFPVWPICPLSPFSPGTPGGKNMVNKSHDLSLIMMCSNPTQCALYTWYRSKTSHFIIGKYCIYHFTLYYIKGPNNHKL